LKRAVSSGILFKVSSQLDINGVKGVIKLFPAEVIKMHGQGR
jgi:hypothetical protein